MSTNFDFDLLAEIAESAPVAGSSNFTNYGRAWMDNLQVSSWDTANNTFKKVVYEGGKIGNGETLEFQVHQEITKKDGTTFNKTWFIQLKESGKRSKTDWGEVIKPSVMKTFKDLKSFFKSLSGNGSYCAIEDFDTGRDSKKNDSNGNPYPVTIPKFTALFKNESECKKAQAARFNNGNAPKGVTKEVINLFKGFVSSVGGLEQAVELLPDDQYEGYDLNEVIKASGLS